jgi:hypothetical protein
MAGTQVRDVMDRGPMVQGEKRRLRLACSALGQAGWGRGCLLRVDKGFGKRGAGFETRGYPLRVALGPRLAEDPGVRPGRWLTLPTP